MLKFRHILIGLDNQEDQKQQKHANFRCHEMNGAFHEVVDHAIHHVLRMAKVADLQELAEWINEEVVGCDNQDTRISDWNVS